MTFPQTRVTEARRQNEEMAQEKSRYIDLLEEERVNSQKNETRVSLKLKLLRTLSDRFVNG